MNKASPKLLQALAVTAELTGTSMSDAAARVMASDLAAFPEQQIFKALLRCRRELRSSLTIASVLERIEDGRLGPEEAWAHCRSAIGDEHVTVIWTPEMKAAFFVADALNSDPIAARMAFIEKYRTEIQKVRAECKPIKWEVCLGYNKRGREAPILDAVAKGRITHEFALTQLPFLDNPDARVLQLVDNTVKRLSS